eukprot:scaffold15394_cov111-Isochrysis_galbana.AAC.15
MHDAVVRLHRVPGGWMSPRSDPWDAMAVLIGPPASPPAKPQPGAPGGAGRRGSARHLGVARFRELPAEDHRLPPARRALSVSFARARRRCRRPPVAPIRLDHFWRR